MLQISVGHEADYRVKRKGLLQLANSIRINRQSALQAENQISEHNQHNVSRKKA
ncbi:hypothetical protein D3C81_2269890 [compost metagenome]